MDNQRDKKRKKNQRKAWCGKEECMNIAIPKYFSCCGKLNTEGKIRKGKQKIERKNSKTKEKRTLEDLCGRCYSFHREETEDCRRKLKKTCKFTACEEKSPHDPRACPATMMICERANCRKKRGHNSRTHEKMKELTERQQRRKLEEEYEDQKRGLTEKEKKRLKEEEENKDRTRARMKLEREGRIGKQWKKETEQTSGLKEKLDIAIDSSTWLTEAVKKRRKKMEAKRKEQAEEEKKRLKERKKKYRK